MEKQTVAWASGLTFRLIPVSRPTMELQSLPQLGKWREREVISETVIQRTAVIQKIRSQHRHNNLLTPMRLMTTEYNATLDHQLYWHLTLYITLWERAGQTVFPRPNPVSKHSQTPVFTFSLRLFSLQQQS